MIFYEVNLVDLSVAVPYDVPTVPDGQIMSMLVTPTTVTITALASGLTYTTTTWESGWKNPKSVTSPASATTVDNIPWGGAAEWGIASFANTEPGPYTLIATSTASNPVLTYFSKGEPHELVATTARGYAPSVQATVKHTHAVVAGSTGTVLRYELTEDSEDCTVYPWVSTAERTEQVLVDFDLEDGYFGRFVDDDYPTTSGWHFQLWLERGGQQTLISDQWTEPSTITNEAETYDACAASLPQQRAVIVSGNFNGSSMALIVVERDGSSLVFGEPIWVVQNDEFPPGWRDDDGLQQVWDDGLWIASYGPSDDYTGWFGGFACAVGYRDSFVVAATASVYSYASWSGNDEWVLATKRFSVDGLTINRDTTWALNKDSSAAFPGGGDGYGMVAAYTEYDRYGYVVTWDWGVGYPDTHDTVGIHKVDTSRGRVDATVSVTRPNMPVPTGTGWSSDVRFPDGFSPYVGWDPSGGGMVVAVVKSQVVVGIGIDNDQVNLPYPQGVAYGGLDVLVYTRDLTKVREYFYPAIYSEGWDSDYGMAERFEVYSGWNWGDISHPKASKGAVLLVEADMPDSSAEITEEQWLGFSVLVIGPDSVFECWHPDPENVAWTDGNTNRFGIYAIARCSSDYDVVCRVDVPAGVAGAGEDETRMNQRDDNRGVYASGRAPINTQPSSQQAGQRVRGGNTYS